MAEGVGTTTASRANLAFGLGIGALAAFVLGWFFAGENDENGWIWLVMGALSLAAVVTGLMARRGGGRAITGLVIGGLLLLLFLGFATGILE
jgi:hypothetical protein